MKSGSSWSRVIPILEAKGLKVVAVQNPLSSLADDFPAPKWASELQKDSGELCRAPTELFRLVIRRAPPRVIKKRRGFPLNPGMDYFNESPSFLIHARSN